MAEELLSCGCNPDDNDVVHLSRYAIMANARMDFETVLHKIVCRKCGRCTGEHIEEDVIKHGGL